MLNVILPDNLSLINELSNLTDRFIQKIYYLHQVHMLQDFFIYEI